MGSGAVPELIFHALPYLTMVNIELPGPVPGVAELRLVVDALETLGIGEAMITGGCLRDAFYKRQREAKDIDIAVWGLGNDDLHVLYDQLHELGFSWGRKDNEWAVMPHVEPSDADAERIDRVWQIISPYGPLVDILVYTNAYDCWQQVLMSHDHSINMFGAMLSTGYDVEVWFPFGNMGRCYQMRDHVNGARIDHIRAICKELGVVYSDAPTYLETRGAHLPTIWEGTDMEGNVATLTLPYRGR